MNELNKNRNTSKRGWAPVNKCGISFILVAVLSISSVVTLRWSWWILNISLQKTKVLMGPHMLMHLFLLSLVCWLVFWFVRFYQCPPNSMHICILLKQKKRPNRPCNICFGEWFVYKMIKMDSFLLFFYLSVSFCIFTA